MMCFEKCHNDKIVKKKKIIETMRENLPKMSHFAQF